MLIILAGISLNRVNYISKICHWNPGIPLIPAGLTGIRPELVGECNVLVVVMEL